MAKDFSAIYGSQNDAIALEQKIFLKEETNRGVLAVPAGTDFMYSLSGGSVNFSQPVESSPHRSGRHHTNIIRKKTTTSWTIPSFFNIDTAAGQSVAEIDPAVALLWRSLMGKVDVTGGYNEFTTGNDPDVTFSIYQNGDTWAIQAPGSFVESGNATFPGDGEAQTEFAGMSKTALTVGVGQSVTNNDGGNTITLNTGEGACFPVGAKVMVIESDGLTRSGDTPDGSPRTVTDATGDVITVDGAVLADSDGSGTPIYLSYYEPVTPVAINDPVTGLVGSITIAGFPNVANCVRNATVNMVNNHELLDYCYGEEGLGGPLFAPGGRFTAEVSLELNLNKELIGFMNSVRQFDGEDITLILGDGTGRHFEMLIPKAIFAVPEITVPDTGTIPVTFTGNAYQTGIDLADEVTASFK